MTKSHVLRAFKQAGFPMRNDGGDEYRYCSSTVSVRYIRQWGTANWVLSVFAFRGNVSEFDTVAGALRCIRARMAMAYVPGNDFALNTGPRGELRLVKEAA